MKRRLARAKTSGQVPQQDHAANQNRALIHVDGKAIRNKIKKDYEKATRDLENSRRQLDQFYQTDVPQFTRWLNTQFGALLTEVRELSQKIALDEELIFEIEEETFLAGGSYARAYQRVMKFRENPEPQRPEPQGGGKAAGERDSQGARETSGGFSDEEDDDDLLDDFFDQLFGNSAPDEEMRGDHGPRSQGHPESNNTAQESKRIKELYRALVRRLHPDSQKEMTPQKTEWWHQVQAAYQSGDADQLEVILSLCEISDHGTTAHTSASLLQRITAQLKSSLREIKRQLGALRRDPAWNFSLSDQHEALSVRLRRELIYDLERMRSKSRAMQELITKWKTAAEQLKQPRRKKKPPQGKQSP